MRLLIFCLLLVCLTGTIGKEVTTLEQDKHTVFGYPFAFYQQDDTKTNLAQIYPYHKFPDYSRLSTDNVLPYPFVFSLGVIWATLAMIVQIAVRIYLHIKENKR